MSAPVDMSAPGTTSGGMDQFLADAILDNMQTNLHMITQDNATILFTRITGLENGQAGIYGEVTHVQDDVATVGDEVARLAYMVEQLAKKQEQRMLMYFLVMFMMLGVMFIMLGTIIYVVSLPVTVCPFSFPMGPNHTEPANHTDPVDVCKNATNTIIDGLRCLTDKMLPKPCRDGYACKRETYPDF